MITEQTVNATFSIEPVQTDTATQMGGPAGTTGFVLNGVKIDAGTGGSCNDAGDACSLELGLFGTHKSEQKLRIRVSRKNKTEREVLTFTPAKPSHRLFNRPS